MNLVVSPFVACGSLTGTGTSLRRRLMKRIIAFILVCFAVTGCARSPVLPSVGSAPYNEAQQTIDQLFTAYRSGYVRIVLGEMVRDGLLSSRKAFIEKVEHNYPQRGIASMQGTFDPLRMTDTVMVLNVLWEKKFNSIGGAQPQRGKARLTFRRDSGAWLLSNIAGDDPFR